MDGAFQYEIEKSPNDQYGNKVTTVKCHGKLVSETAGEMREVLIPLGGRIVIDLSGLNHMDSAGLGGLVGLKVSALKQGYCILEFVNMTPRILEMLRVSNLTRVLTS